MQKQAHSTFSLVVPSKVSNFCDFNNHFFLKLVIHPNFVVPVFQGCDLCDKDGKQYHSTFALVVSSENLIFVVITPVFVK